MKSQREIIAAAEEWVRSLHGNDTGGHDWHHVNRVRQMALRIAEEEGTDCFLVELMAILHDAADRKAIGYGNEEKMLGQIRCWLQTQDLPDDSIKEIMYVIEHQSFSKSGLGKYTLKSKAGQCVQDADRLDGIGAIGVGRCFAYGGKRGRPLYDPDLPFRELLTFEEYRKCPSSLHHFTEKLFFVAGLMNTAAGKRLAQERHDFMKMFFDRFRAEWRGEC